MVGLCRKYGRQEQSKTFFFLAFLLRWSLLPTFGFWLLVCVRSLWSWFVPREQEAGQVFFLHVEASVHAKTRGEFEGIFSQLKPAEICRNGKKEAEVSLLIVTAALQRYDWR
jgi:hypothetical protein